MPVLSEDSGECFSALKIRRRESRLLSAGSQECEPGRECSQDRLMCGLRAPWGFPWGVSLGVSVDPCVCCTLFSFTLAGLHETLALLTSQLRPDSNHKEEMGFLKDVFSEKSLSYLMKVKPPFIPSGEGFWRSPSPPRCPRKASRSPLCRPSLSCSVDDPVCSPAAGRPGGVQGKVGSWLGRPQPEIAVFRRFTRSFAITRGKAQPLSCTAPWPSPRM